MQEPGPDHGPAGAICTKYHIFLLDFRLQFGNALLNTLYTSQLMIFKRQGPKNQYAYFIGENMENLRNFALIFHFLTFKP